MIRSAAALYRGAQNNSNFGVISFENRVDYVENSTNNEEFPLLSARSSRGTREDVQEL